MAGSSVGCYGSRPARRDGVAEVINLRTARKAKARAAATAQADRNRIAHGRTKGEKQAAKLEAETLRKKLDGARLEGSSED